MYSLFEVEYDRFLENIIDCVFPRQGWSSFLPETPMFEVAEEPPMRVFSSRLSLIP